jgi:mono/diheme cytochrome c family protein
MLRGVMRRVISTVTVLVAAVAISACGDKSNLPSNESASVKTGAQLFKARCAGCHTMDTVNALGGATKVRDREVVDGPNFNVRKETKDNVLYAIRNGGFSAAIMPQNIVVGKDADMVAEFLSKYAGVEAKPVVDPGSSTASKAPGN